MLLAEKYAMSDIATMLKTEREEGGSIKLYELVQKKKLSIADAADDMDITEEEFINKMKFCGYKLP